MAVPASQRHSNIQLNAITKAIELESYTILITKNSNNFPAEYFTHMTSVIVNLSQSILNNLTAANSIRVVYPEDFVLRRNYQLSALGDIDSLNVQLMVAKKVFKIKNKRYKYWSGLLFDTKCLAQNWINKDNERYGTSLNNSHNNTYNKIDLPEYTGN
jgi:archaellin